MAEAAAVVSVTECNVCFEPYNPKLKEKLPRLLLCGHTFCSYCLGNLIVSERAPTGKGTKKTKVPVTLGITCPTCRSFTPTNSDTDPSCLKQNFALTQILESNILIPGDEVAACSECEKKAAEFCQDCTSDFCEDCGEKIHAFKTTKNHKRVPIHKKLLRADVDTKCEEHNDELKFFCVDDEVPICGMCRDAQFGAHHDHKIDLIFRIAKKKRDELKRYSSKLNTVMEGLLQRSRDIVNVVEVVRGDKTGIKREVNQELNQIIQILKRRGAQMASVIDQKSEEWVSELNAERDVTSVLISEIEALQLLLEKKSQSEDFVLLSSLKDVNKKYEGIQNNAKNPKPVIKRKLAPLFNQQAVTNAITLSGIHDDDAKEGYSPTHQLSLAVTVGKITQLGLGAQLKAGNDFNQKNIIKEITKAPQNCDTAAFIDFTVKPSVKDFDVGGLMALMKNILGEAIRQGQPPDNPHCNSHRIEFSKEDGKRILRVMFFSQMGMIDIANKEIGAVNPIEIHKNKKSKRPEYLSTVPGYTMDEVEKHNTPQDCWIVIRGGIYDVTQFKIDHPGGSDVLEECAARDASLEWEDIFHSKAAERQMQQYCIGFVKNYFPPKKRNRGDRRGGGGAYNPPDPREIIKKNFEVFFGSEIDLQAELYLDFNANDIMSPDYVLMEHFIGALNAQVKYRVPEYIHGELLFIRGLRSGSFSLNFTRPKEMAEMIENMQEDENLPPGPAEFVQASKKTGVEILRLIENDNNLQQDFGRWPKPVQDTYKRFREVIQGVDQICAQSNDFSFSLKFDGLDIVQFFPELLG